MAETGDGATHLNVSGRRLRAPVGLVAKEFLTDEKGAVRGCVLLG